MRVIFFQQRYPLGHAERSIRRAGHENIFYPCRLQRLTKLLRYQQRIILFQYFTGDATGPRIVPAMTGIDSDPEFSDIRYRRLSPDTDNQLSAGTVISQVMPPVLYMF